VRVRVPVGPPQQAVAIPVNALRKGPEGDHVYVITADKEGKPRAYARPVASGPVVGGDIVIEEGLVAGERVAASGSFKLREAVLVAIAQSGTPGAASPLPPQAAPGATDTGAPQASASESTGSQQASAAHADASRAGGK
jgi:membrane fusion protein (multidrug efflux system)